MIKKFIVLVLMIVTLTGCDAVYKLEFTNDSFKETLTINNLSNYQKEAESVYTSDLTTDIENDSDLSREDALALGYKFYEKSLDYNNGITLKYYYDFSKDEYSNSYIARFFYPYLVYSYNNLNSGDAIKVYDRYPNLNNITIEFSTDKIVTSNNADEIKNNTYYWYLNKENYKNKKIELKFSEKEENIIDDLKENIENFENVIESNHNFNWNVVFISLGIVLLFIIMFIFIKVKNSNKK